MCGHCLCGDKVLMWKIGKNNTAKITVKRGFTLIEVLCSIVVFSLLFMAALCIQVSAVKVKNYNQGVNRCTLIMEYVKNNIEYNFSYEDVLNLYEKGRVYLNCDELKVENMEKIKVYNSFSDVKPEKEPYIILNVTEGEVLKINLQFCRKIYGNIKVDKCEFYKGNYKR